MYIHKLKYIRTCEMPLILFFTMFKKLCNKNKLGKRHLTLQVDIDNIFGCWSFKQLNDFLGDSCGI